MFSCFWQVTTVLYVTYFDLAARSLHVRQALEEDGTMLAAELLQHRSRLSTPHDVTLSSKQTGPGSSPVNGEIPNPLLTASEPDSFQMYTDLMTQKAALLKWDLQHNLI